MGERFVWDRADAMGPRSAFGVEGFRRSFPACDACLGDVAMIEAPVEKQI